VSTTKKRGPKSGRKKRGARPYEPLTRERIVGMAVALIDASGLEDFSTRRLGLALGVEAMSIYHHFPSKGELLDAIASALLGEVELAGPEAGGWRRRLERVVLSYLDVARRHPEAFTLLALRRLNSPEAYRFLEHIFGCLAEGGFDAHMRARIFRLLGHWATGAALSELAVAARAPHATRAVAAEEMDAVRYPLTTQSTRWLMPDRFDDTFDFGARAVFDAIERMPRSSK
jgi:AcrR family transcriptional regulator